MKSCHFPPQIVTFDPEGGAKDREVGDDVGIKVSSLRPPGPDGGCDPFRRTEQAILQLLDSAQDSITLVSFAVYSIPNIAKALVKAAQRGVKLTVIVETPDKLGSENEYSTLRALGSEVEACSSVYYWPKEKHRHPIGRQNGDMLPESMRIGGLLKRKGTDGVNS